MQPIGFISLYESHALYAGGAFGTIPEFYVHPSHRDKNVGSQLLSAAKTFAEYKGWSRLEVNTPPLPEFESTLHFYEHEKFKQTGCCKLQFTL